jgi:hypothetical protein
MPTTLVIVSNRESRLPPLDLRGRRMRSRFLVSAWEMGEANQRPAEKTGLPLVALANWLRRCHLNMLKSIFPCPMTGSLPFRA